MPTTLTKALLACTLYNLHEDVVTIDDINKFRKILKNQVLLEKSEFHSVENESTYFIDSPKNDFSYSIIKNGYFNEFTKKEERNIDDNIVMLKTILINQGFTEYESEIIISYSMYEFLIYHKSKDNSLLPDKVKIKFWLFKVLFFLNTCYNTARNEW